MTPAVRTRPLRSLVGARRSGARFALALCAALLAAVGLGGVAAPALGAAAAPGAAGSVGYGATPTPATARAVGHGALNGPANRVRPHRQQENSKPAFATAQRGQPDGAPVAVSAVQFVLAEPLLPAGRALTSTPSRAPPATTGLPDTRAPPAPGRL